MSMHMRSMSSWLLPLIGLRAVQRRVCHFLPLHSLVNARRFSYLACCYGRRRRRGA